MESLADKSYDNCARRGGRDFAADAELLQVGSVKVALHGGGSGAARVGPRVRFARLWML
jgi:hypothetical protein